MKLDELVFIRLILVIPERIKTKKKLELTQKENSSKVY